MTKKAQRMLAAMDRANTLWNIPNIGRAKGRVIRRLIDRHRPTRAIEVGSLLGYSAILIAGALPPGGKLICLEANDYLAKFVKSNAEEAGLGRRVTRDGRRRAAGDPAAAGPLRLRAPRRAQGRLPRLSAPARAEARRPARWWWPTIPACSAGTWAQYLAYVRDPAGRWQSREYDFGDDTMEVSVLRGRD